MVVNCGCWQGRQQQLQVQPLLVLLAFWMRPCERAVSPQMSLCDCWQLVSWYRLQAVALRVHGGHHGGAQRPDAPQAGSTAVSRPAGLHGADKSSPVLSANVVRTCSVVLLCFCVNAVAAMDSGMYGWSSSAASHAYMYMQTQLHVVGSLYASWLCAEGMGTPCWQAANQGGPQRG